MSIRTDLAVEKIEIAGEILPEGVEKSEDTKSGLKITKISIKESKASNILGKPIGEYITIETNKLQNSTSNFEGEVSVIAEQISSILKKDGLILVVGLGNSDITPDAIGPLTINSVLATRHISKDLASSIGLDNLKPVAAISPSVLGKTGMETAEIIESLCNSIKPEAVIVVDALASKSIDRLGVAAISPSVLGKTGMETAEIIESLCNSIKPEAVIVVDALASKSIDRLGATIQISDTGISPGSGVQNKRKELSKTTLGVPVIAIGIPTVVDMTTIASTIQISDTGISPGSGVQNKRKELSKTTLGVPVIAIGIPTVVDMTTIAYDLLGEGFKSEKVSTRGRTLMVTPREIDELVKQASKLVSCAINKALQPSLSLEEIEGLAV